MLFHNYPLQSNNLNVEGKVYILVKSIKSHGLHIQKGYWK